MYIEHLGYLMNMNVWWICRMYDRLIYHKLVGYRMSMEVLGYMISI